MTVVSNGHVDLPSAKFTIPQSRFQAAIRSGDFVVTAEVMPPKGGDPSHMMKWPHT